MTDGGNMNMPTSFTALDALLGRSRDNWLQQLPTISEENASLARQFIEIARRLNQEGKVQEATQLTDAIRAFLNNNSRLQEITKEAIQSYKS